MFTWFKLRKLLNKMYRELSAEMSANPISARYVGLYECKEQLRYIAEQMGIKLKE